MWLMLQHHAHCSVFDIFSCSSVAHSLCPKLTFANCSQHGWPADRHGCILTRNIKTFGVLLLTTHHKTTTTTTITIEQHVTHARPPKIVSKKTRKKSASLKPRPHVVTRVRSAAPVMWGQCDFFLLISGRGRKTCPHPTSLERSEARLQRFILSVYL